jgi:ornithine decarboxylase
MLIKIRLPIAVWRNGKRLTQDPAFFQIFGPTCDSVDELPKTRLPNAIQTGDYIEFAYLGAYGSSTATVFNGFNSNTYLKVLEQTHFS